MTAEIRVGTCSWADEALTKAFYPPGLPAGERLAWYAEHFDTVEVDSTYYRLPAEDMVRRWAERTPDDFVMHVKAFGVMTRHPVKADQLPPDLRDEAPVDDRGRVERPSREFRGEIFRRFHEALEPLRGAGKLGGILLQFPPYVVPRESSYDYLEWAVGQLGGDAPLVEFRHRSWYEGDQLAETLSLLERLGAAHVVVDAPQVEAKNVPPTVLAVTAPVTYTRFHGRNAGTWNVRERAPPSASTTSTRRTSCASGPSSCASSPARRSRRSRSSTTTTAARDPAARPSRRRPGTRTCSSGCSPSSQWARSNRRTRGGRR